MPKAALAGLSPIEQLPEQTTPLEDVLFIEANIWRA
jgi:hypothetical protein